MNWTSLNKIDADVLQRGTVLRTDAQYPYEEIVDFMLMENSNAKSGFSLWVTTGYKAGLPLINLPIDSIDPDRNGVRVAWLRENWQVWIYESSTPDQVFISSGYAAKPVV